MVVTCQPPPDSRGADYWATYRNKVVITPELIAHCKLRASQGLNAGDIALEIKWPQHVSLRRIMQWIDGVKSVRTKSA